MFACPHSFAIRLSFLCDLFSSAVPPGSGAFQMPTRPSSSAASVSTLRGEGPISETLLLGDINHISKDRFS